MHQAALFVVLALFVAQCYGSVQVQMPDAAELQQPDDDLHAQVQELQKNVTAVWNYIYELRSAVSYHLTHLRQHQVELETAMHRMDHLHESALQSTAHHHSGEQHSHSGEHHSHGNEHSHGSDHSHGDEHSHGSDHSHGDEHSHGSDHSHSSMDSHSHSDDHHHHDDEHGHHSHSYSHSHSSHDHSKEDSHSHSSHDHSKEDSHSHAGHDDHHDHKDSHETEDLQETQKVVPVAEPIITATTRQEHYHHHHHQSTNSDTLNLLNEHDHDHHHHHHDHRHDSSSTGKNRTVVRPKLTEYGLYDLAMCRVQPNSALPEDQKQNIFGTITMWQKKTGGPLNFHVRVQGFEMGDHHAHQQQTIQTEEETQESHQPMSHKHGFHIHALGDFSNGCQSAGPHYNPKGVNHGGPDSLVRHVGDLGNIECDEHGLTNIVFADDIASLKGQYSIIGKSIVIHAREDDKGLGGDDESLNTGNAGTRLACCVIESVEKIPFRQYKAMKTATQRNN